ncbi:MAG: hypothetical protein H0X51_07220 [Parachlamydiaceae bacterium]|nr:hypothetical protein [Parachlamydiaceae bacterium]
METLATSTLVLGKYQSTERTATVAIRATTVKLKAPITCKKKSWKSVTINAILVSEIDPPKGITPLEWLLLTTLPIESTENVLRAIRLYAQWNGIICLLNMVYGYELAQEVALSTKKA